ncbi:SURF1 family protein [Streptomyces gobiensis]|uniref:SURF1 family cytochrome oxidase biogenesis protein n=1 Tax=Streptomyces gobiensis TaxID=2875706 RepID=UPI001E43ECB8|nr:SURF1 family protein [Streptomyces gobiensis]UGY90658.1 SURF1 family protein [Streptomyces gobiensis]
MYRFLLSRQWVILTLVALVLIPVMVQLGFWQLHRHQARVAHNQLVADSLAAEPVPIGELTGPGREVADSDRYRPVTATGSYDTEHEVVVRRRTAADGRKIGYFVLTPLIQRDGSAVLVNRGWVSPGEDQTSFPEVPAAPSGKITVTGRLLPDETTARSGIKDRPGLPPRQVMLINSEQQTRALGRPVLGGFIELTDTEPKPSEAQLAQPVPEPDHSGIGAHMAYAVQWWLFAAAVPVGWVVLVRRERRDRSQERTATAAQRADGALASATSRTAD